MSISNNVCPVCEEGRLTVESYDGEIKHNGAALAVHGLERCRCDVCGADPVLTEQIRRNQIRIADARRVHDGLLTCEEIREARELVGISQAEAAKIFGGGTNAFSKYERGEVEQSVAMDRLIRIARDLPEAAQFLAAYAGVSISHSYASAGYVAACRSWSVAKRVISNNRARLTLVHSGEYKIAQ